MQVMIVEDDKVFIGSDYLQPTVMALKERCEEKGLSKCCSKAEFIKILGIENPEGLQVVKRKSRGRKVADNVKVESDEDDHDDS